MTTRTRYFVIASLLVLAVGIGTGLVAYYVGLPTSAFSTRGGPEELKYVPRNVAMLAYANVQDVMASELRQRVKQAIPMHENGQREFQDKTGINIETDIDRVVACFDADRASSNFPGSALVLARGRFDEVKIEALMREHGAQVENYKGKRLVVANFDRRKDAADPDPNPQATPERAELRRHADFAVAFLEPGLVAVGSASLIRNAVDIKDGGANVTTNDELMTLVRSLDSGNAWAVGRFDALTAKAKLPEGVASRLPAITWFSVSTRVNGGVRGVMRAEARDDEAANNLRDIVRGFLALAKMQSGSNPGLQTMLQSLELSGTGKTVALAFAVPTEVFDLIGAAAGVARKPKGD